MKKFWRTAVLASLITGVGFGIVGCEWESPGSDEYWSDSYNWVNFSGVYKNPNGGSVVTDFTSSVIPATNSSSSTAVAVGPVTVGFGNGGNTYSGQLLANVVPGSLQITAGGVVFTDNGSGLLVSSSGSGSMSGSISYGSGAWNINLGGVMVPSGQPITARYSVFQSAGTTVISGTSSKVHGSTGNKILSLTVMQEGNLLTLIDSDGMNYSGKMGTLRTSTGNTSDGTVLDAPRQGDIVIGQFSVKGVSRAGLQVEIVGVLQSTVANGGGLLLVMTARSIQGQWIEKGGKVGDVVGAATDAAINWTATGTVNQNLN